ncbi:hypothetical protein [Pseudogulbenkiania sp. MAI-1]|uniref:hypothetical protein n=1 Tax=Pseudogulbenkiania sp. MAI-1 TaxID=990370 RepID=UPI00045E8948|nr:hypothetical protein [Pseudogulbenkiania sp. MAI-1]
MSDDNYLVPSDGGSLQPLSPSTPLVPSAPAEFGQVDYWVDPTGDSPRSTPITTGTGRIFGVEVPGVSVRDLQVNLVQPIADLFRQEMASRGISPRSVELAANWYVQNCQKMPIAEHKYHSYDLRGFDITPEDRAPITAFCNFMDEHGVDGNTVRLFLSWNYRALPQIIEQWAQQNRVSSLPAGGAATLDSLSESQLKLVMGRQKEFQQNTKDRLRNLWGNAYGHRMEVAAGYFASLPEADRIYFESTVCQGGIILGDSVDAIVWAYNQAIAQAKPVVNVGSDSLAGEIASIEKIMVEDRARYNKDIAMQERLRLLYQARDGG